MYDFSPSEAAFAGWRWVFVRLDQAWLIVLGYALIDVLRNLVVVALAGPALIDMQVAASAEDWKAVLFVLSKPDAIAGLAIGFLLVIIMTISTSTAAYRRMLYSQHKTVWGFALGQDERNLALFFLAINVLNIIIIGVAVLIIHLGTTYFGWPGIVRLLILVSTAILCLWLNLRISLIAPKMIDKPEPRIAQAFFLTRGRVWKLFGAFVISGVLGILALIVGTVICAILFMPFVGLSGVGRMLNPDLSSLAANLELPILLYRLATGLVNGAAIVAFCGTATHAYLALMGRDPATGEALISA